MKNIMVISHPRSGTHFAINTIAKNFSYTNNWYLVPQVTDYNTLKKFFESVSSERVFKSHHSFAVLEKLIPIILNRFKVFYIMRDGRDVMVSMWYFFNNANKKLYPHTNTVGELMRTDPRKWKMGGEYDLKVHDNYVSRWLDHVKLWYDFASTNDNVMLLDYESLNHNFNNCVCNISSFLNLSTPNEIIKPTLNDRGVLNRKGTVGDYVNHFTEEDYIFYNSIIGNNLEGFKYA